MPKKFQSTVEYILMMIALLLVLIWAFSRNGPLRPAFAEFFNDLGNTVSNIIDNSDNRRHFFDNWQDFF
jgi:hypothetical protein